MLASMASKSLPSPDRLSMLRTNLGSFVRAGNLQGYTRLVLQYKMEHPNQYNLSAPLPSGSTLLHECAAKISEGYSRKTGSRKEDIEEALQIFEDLVQRGADQISVRSQNLSFDTFNAPAPIGETRWLTRPKTCNVLEYINRMLAEYVEPGYQAGAGSHQKIRVPALQKAIRILAAGPLHIHPYPSPTEKTLLHDLSKILHNGTIPTDVTFLLDDGQGSTTKCSAHSVIVCARSPVFKTMFASTMVEGKTHQVGPIVCDSVCFNAMLFWLYNDSFEMEYTCTQLTDILLLGDKYDVPSLLQHCEVLLSARLDVDNAISMVLFAKSHINFASYLFQQCVNFVAKNKMHLMQQQEFSQLAQFPEVLMAILTVGSVNVGEQKEQDSEQKE